MPPDDTHERTYLSSILDRQLPREELLDALQARLKEARKDENYRYLTFPVLPGRVELTDRLAALDTRSNQEVYNVRELSIGFSDALYICDGIDDQEQFKMAIASVPEGEEIVLRIGPGTYNFGGVEPLRLGRRKISFIGTGQGNTIFRPAASSTMGSILNNYLDPVHNLTVSAITFDLSSRPDVGAMHIHQGDFVHVSNCEFMGQRSIQGNIWLLRFGDYKGDPNANASYNLSFHDNYIHNNECGTYELLLVVNEKFPTIERNRFENNKTDAYEIVLYINNYFSVIANNQFNDSKAKSIGVMESQETLVVNNVAVVDDVRFVSVINCKDTRVVTNTVTCKSTVTGESSCVELFDRQLGPDGHQSLINPSTEIEITGNTINDFKFGIRAQIVGHIGVNDYKLNQRDILIERNNFNNIKYLPIAIGVDHIDNTLSHIRVLRNNINSWSGDYIGAITFRGYNPAPMRGELHIQGNTIAPSTKNNTSGIRLINTIVSTVVNNDIRGTGKTYSPISLVSASVVKASNNLI